MVESSQQQKKQQPGMKVINEHLTINTFKHIGSDLEAIMYKGSFNKTGKPNCKPIDCAIKWIPSKKMKK